MVFCLSRSGQTLRCVLFCSDTRPLYTQRMDEASRLAALLQEEDDDTPPGPGEINVDQLLNEFGGDEAEDVGDISSDGIRSLNDNIDDLLEGSSSRLPAEHSAAAQDVTAQDVSGSEGTPLDAMTGKQSPTFGGLLSFFKGAITNTGDHAGGAFAERLQASIRKTVGTITTKTDDLQGTVEPTESTPPPSSTATVEGSGARVTSVRGSLMNFASQVASSIGETVSLHAAVEPPAPPSFPSDDFVEVTDDSQISLWAYLSSAHPVRSVESKLRPDVSQDSILSLFETIVLSHGLVVKERGSGALVVERSGSGGRWSMVACKLGVSLDRHRILLLQFFAPSKVALSSSPSSQPSMLSTTVAPSAVGAELVDALASALLEAKLTLSSLNTDEEVVVDLDPHYIKGMQAMCAAEMMATLATYARPLEAYLKEQEIRCARLMTTLQPVYGRLGLAIPRPHRAKALTAFPLDTARPPVAEASLDSARQLLAKIQSQYRKEGTMDVVRRVWRELQEWADEESRARVKRKNQQVAARLRNVEQHAQSLVTTLRDQQGGTLGTVETHLTSAFRAAAGEVVLLDVGATYASRPGRLYVTCSHLWFHFFSFHRALPLSGLRSVEQASALGLGNRVLCVVDNQGERHNFLITTLSPPDVVDRVVDLVRLTLECWKRQQAAAGDVSKDGELGVRGAAAEADEGEELAKRLAGVGMGDEATPPSVQSRQQEVQDAVNGTKGSNVATAVELAALLGADMEGMDEALPTPPQSISASDDADMLIESLGKASVGNDLDGGTAGSGAATAKSRSLRSGIQAFLSENHSNTGSKKPSPSIEEPLLDFS